MPVKLTQDEFISKANIKHNNLYDYSLVEYKGNQIKVKIKCPKHGIFEQQPNNHLFGQRCVKCMGDNVRKARKFSIEQWIKKFKEIHGEKYDYSKVKEFLGNGSKNKIIIMCNKHGEFFQRPTNHCNGEGCPYCKSSKGENQIEKYLIENNIKYIREYKFEKCINLKTNKKLPFDFYLPNQNLIIEFHGEQHYKKMGKYFENRAGGLEGRKYRDNIKFKFCNINNINYLKISYKEINNIEQILKIKL